VDILLHFILNTFSNTTHYILSSQ